MSLIPGAAVWRPPRNTFILPASIFGMGVLLSLLLFAVVRGNIEDAAEGRFDHQATEAKRVVEARIQSYADVLFSVRSLFDANGSVSRLQFRRFVEGLDLEKRFPGIEVVNYAVPVGAEDKERFEEAVRRDASLERGGYPRFAIKPAGERPEYHVLVYLEPFAGNEFAFGLDIATPNPAASSPEAAKAALYSARDSGRLT